MKEFNETFEFKGKAFYAGKREDWYGKEITIEAFKVFWCRPQGEKSFLKCLATITVDDCIHTNCELNEIIPFSNHK